MSVSAKLTEWPGCSDSNCCIEHGIATKLSLDHDVLLLIFSLLGGKDALHTCLACKKAYILAIPRLASSAQWWTPDRLRQLCDYYLSTDPFTRAPRVKYLEILTIHATTFDLEHVASDSQDLDLDHVDHLELELVGTDFSHAHFLRDLLDGAQNIRELSLDRFHYLVRKDSRIAISMASMDQLAHVRLAMTLPPLLKVLAPFPNLHTLKIWNFTPPHPDDTIALPLIPSTRYLRLSQSSVPALDMVQLFPKLSTLVFSIDSEEGDVVASFSPRWPPFRRIMVSSPDTAVCVVDRLSAVRLLQVSGMLRIEDTREDGDIVSRFLDPLRAASPVGLYAS